MTCNCKNCQTLDQIGKQVADLVFETLGQAAIIGHCDEVTKLIRSAAVQIAEAAEDEVAQRVQDLFAKAMNLPVGTDPEILRAELDRHQREGTIEAIFDKLYKPGKVEEVESVNKDLLN